MDIIAAPSWFVQSLQAMARRTYAERVTGIIEMKSTKVQTLGTFIVTEISLLYSACYLKIAGFRSLSSS